MEGTLDAPEELHLAAEKELLCTFRGNLLYCMRKEHELDKESQTLPDEVLEVLVMLRDSLLQYELMSIPNDYL